LLNDLAGTRVEAGTTLFFFDREFVSLNDGDTHRMEDEVNFPGTFYLSHAINDKVAAGLGMPGQRHGSKFYCNNSSGR
jgi:long-chain fatty acid transport protein